MQSNHANLFIEQRNSMVSLAYRMLGSICEAEDIVSEVYIKWQQQDLNKIKNVKAWLMKVCSNTALDLLKKSYRKREVYPGTWLPEPRINDLAVWEESTADPDSITTAFLLLLEKLNPIEHTVFLLHDVFSYRFKYVASVVERSESNCRKISERARKRIQSHKVKFDTPSVTDLLSLEKFFIYVKHGEIEQVKSFLADDVEFWSDGGGKVSAVPMVLNRQQKISKFFINMIQHTQRQNITYKSEFTTVNQRQGLILSKQLNQGNWHMETVFSFEFINGKVARIFAVRNPDKLKH